MEINKDSLTPFLMYSDPIQYNESITLYPVTMAEIIPFQMYSQALTVRKNSRFPVKAIIKMSYLDFLIQMAINSDYASFGEDYEMPMLNQYLIFTMILLRICCKTDEVTFDGDNLYINGCLVDNKMFDDLRRIIIIQNDIDFDIDEFLNFDTQRKLEEAQQSLNKDVDKSTLEDYIDSLCVALHYSEEEIKQMTIRKFWRFIKRYNLHENYTIMRTGECSGMVSFKEPIKHWMATIEDQDKYADVKANSNDIKNKVSG